MKKKFNLFYSVGQEDYGVSLDFSNYTNVTVRSQHELEKVLRVGLRRSSNWAEKRELEKSMIVQPKVEYHNNMSHMICKLTFVNPTQKTQFAFYLADLIGFENVMHCFNNSLNLPL